MSPIQKAWAEDADWIMQFKRLPGMSVGKMRERAAAMGHEEEDYVAHYEKKIAMNIHRSSDELSRYGVL